MKNDSMADKTESELEGLLHGELQRLPTRRAPETLAPRVLAAIAARSQLRWWQQSLWNWPVAARWSLSSLLALFAGLAVAFVWIYGESLIPGEAGALFQQVQALWEAIGVLGNAFLMLLRTVVQPWLLAGMAVSFFMYLVCLGAGTAILRVALRRI